MKNMFTARRTRSFAKKQDLQCNFTPTSRFFMSADVIAHLLRLSELKMVMAFCSHGSNPGTTHIDLASHTYIGQPLTRISLLLYASKLP